MLQKHLPIVAKVTNFPNKYFFQTKMQTLEHFSKFSQQNFQEKFPHFQKIHNFPSEISQCIKFSEPHLLFTKLVFPKVLNQKHSQQQRITPKFPTAQADPSISQQQYFPIKTFIKIPNISKIFEGLPYSKQKLADM